MSDITKFERLKHEYERIFQHKNNILTKLIEISQDIKRVNAEIRLDTNLLMKLKREKQRTPMKQIEDRKTDAEKKLKKYNSAKQKLHLQLLAKNKKLQDLMTIEE